MSALSRSVTFLGEAIGGGKSSLRLTLIAAGEKIGPATAAFFQALIADRPHPEQGFRTCLGILALTKSYGNTRVDAACQRGILIKARSVASIRSILKNGLDRAFLDETPDHQPLAPRQHPRSRLFPLNHGVSQCSPIPPMNG